MKIINLKNNYYVLRIDSGEEIIGAIKNFCAENNIKAGHFAGIGSVKELVLSFYDLAKKEYLDKNFNEFLEITGLNGNIAVKEGETIIHAHGNFSNEGMAVFGGHVKKAVVSATCEIYLKKIEGEIQREHSEEIGLNLIQ